MDISEIKSNNAHAYTKDNTVYLKGDFDLIDTQTFLDPFFNEVIVKMENEIILDLSGINFMNSSVITSLVTFFLNRKPLSKITVRINKLMPWQRTSVKVLAKLDPFKIFIVE